MKQEIRFCTSRDGTRIAYATMGDGPVLVKTANWLSHLDYDFEGPVMGAWFEALAETFTLVRYDERGCGLSDWDTDAFELEALVDNLEAVVDTLELTRFPLLGISQGGPVAVAYAARHPERVSRLVLYGTYARPWMTTAAEEEMLDAMLKVTGAGWGQENPACRQLFATLLMPDATREELNALTELQRRSASPENAVRLLWMCYQLDVSGEAPHVAAPTLVAHSRHDGGVPFESGRELAALIPDAQFVPLESCNHLLLHHEPAWQHLMDAVHGFLEPDHVRHADAFPELSERQREVLELIAQGLDNDTIAERLFISPKTVRNHITHIFRRLDARDRAQAIVLAREAGLGRQVA